MNLKKVKLVNRMSGQSLNMKCPVCQHVFSAVLDEKALEEKAIYCPNCKVQVSLETFNTTTGLAVRGYIPSDVMNEHIAKMKNKDWKEKKGF